MKLSLYNVHIRQNAILMKVVLDEMVCMTKCHWTKFSRSDPYELPGLGHNPSCNHEQQEYIYLYRAGGQHNF